MGCKPHCSQTVCNLVADPNVLSMDDIKEVLTTFGVQYNGAEKRWQVFQRYARLAMVESPDSVKAWMGQSALNILRRKLSSSSFCLGLFLNDQWFAKLNFVAARELTCHQMKIVLALHGVEAPSQINRSAWTKAYNSLIRSSEAGKRDLCQVLEVNPSVNPWKKRKGNPTVKKSPPNLLKQSRRSSLSNRARKKKPKRPLVPPSVIIPPKITPSKRRGISPTESASIFSEVSSKKAKNDHAPCTRTNLCRSPRLRSRNGSLSGCLEASAGPMPHSARSQEDNVEAAWRGTVEIPSSAQQSSWIQRSASASVHSKTSASHAEHELFVGDQAASFQYIQTDLQEEDPSNVNLSSPHRSSSESSRAPQID